MITASAELYDPVSGSFSATSGMANVRYAHRGSFVSTGSMSTARRSYSPIEPGFTATLLPAGKVLIASAPCALYDPTSGTFSLTGSLITARTRHAATLLPSGKVLISGGFSGVFEGSAELYDPATGTFSAAGELVLPREQHTATLLSNGRVLLAGGYGLVNVDNVYLSAAELYDPGAIEMPPTLVKVAPSRVCSSTGRVIVTLTGTNFGAGCTATFGSTPALWTGILTTTTMSAVAPPHPLGTASVTVTCPAGTAILSNAVTFTAPPTITSIQPTSAPSGAFITINGTASKTVQGSRLMECQPPQRSLMTRHFALSSLPSLLPGTGPWR